MPTNAPDGLINSHAARGGLKKAKAKAETAPVEDKPAAAKATTTVKKTTASPK